MQRSALILFAVATLGAIAYLVFLFGEPEAPPMPVVSSPGNDPAVPAPQGRQPLANVPSGAPRVRVEVKELERFVPPPPARILATTADGRELPVELLAGAGAGFDVAADVAGVALVKVAFEGHSLLRQVALAAGAPTRLVIGSRLQVGGHLRNDNGKAIAGAVVWFGELDAEGNRCEFDTDDEGHYAGDVPTGGGVPFLARHPGAAAASWRIIDVAAPVPPVDAVMRRPFTLAVQLLAKTFDAEQARAYVVPFGSVSSEVAQYPFWAQVLGDGCPFNARGEASIAELPAEGELGVVVLHPRLPLSAPKRIVLKGEHDLASLPVQPLAESWRGRVVDEAGAAVAGVSLWSRTPGRDLAAGNSQRLLPPHLGAIGTCFTRSDANGEFELGANSADDAVLTLRAQGRAGRDVPWRSLTPAAAIVLPNWGGGEAEFVLSAPGPGAAWVAETTLSGGLQALVAADETWRVAFPYAGRFDVTVTTFVGEVAVASQHLPDLTVTGSVSLLAPKGP